jgi:hypothetical protein
MLKRKPHMVKIWNAQQMLEISAPALPFSIANSNPNPEPRNPKPETQNAEHT